MPSLDRDMPKQFGPEALDRRVEPGTDFLLTTFLPSTVMLPDVISVLPAIMVSSELLPAPLTPSKAYASPTKKTTPASKTKGQKSGW